MPYLTHHAIGGSRTASLHSTHIHCCIITVRIRLYWKEMKVTIDNLSKVVVLKTRVRGACGFP